MIYSTRKDRRTFISLLTFVLGSQNLCYSEKSNITQTKTTLTSVLGSQSHGGRARGCHGRGRWCQRPTPPPLCREVRGSHTYTCTALRTPRRAPCLGSHPGSPAPAHPAAASAWQAVCPPSG